MTLNFEAALERVLSHGDDWQSWRGLRLAGDALDPPDTAPGRHDDGAYSGDSGRPSPGASGLGLCHLCVVGLGRSGLADATATWLEGARTPARAWLDSPADAPGELDTAAAGRVWATASASCGLLAVGHDPGHRAIDLLRGEADQDGRFTGGAYPTFAAAGAYWAAEGPATEMAEWALRWARETDEDWWGACEWVTALTFWAASGIPAEHASVEAFVESLRADAPAAGWPDELELTLRALEVLAFYG